MIGTKVQRSAADSSCFGNKITEYLIYFYFALSFFEPYLNGVLGSVTKYFIIALAIVLLWHNQFRIRRRDLVYSYMFWLLYRFVTLLWTDNYRMFNQHVLSQMGVVALLIVLAQQQLGKRILTNIVNTMWISSLVIAILTMMFGHAYHGVVEARQVLVLFGQELDPNNQAAFLLVGISIAFYYLIYEKKYFALSFASLFCNSISMFRTGSRGGFVSMLAIILFVMLFNENNNSIKSVAKKLVAFVVIGLILYFVVKNYIPENTFNRLFNSEGYQGGSSRTVIWGNALQLLGEDLNIFFGAGWGDYFGYNGVNHAMHNTYLAMLCDVGILGFSLFFFPIFYNVFYCMREKEYLPVILLMAGFLPCFFLDAINKRFFWNAIMFLFLFVTNYRTGGWNATYETNSVSK